MGTYSTWREKGDSAVTLIPVSSSHAALVERAKDRFSFVECFIAMLAVYSDISSKTLLADALQATFSVQPDPDSPETDVVFRRENRGSLLADTARLLFGWEPDELQIVLRSDLDLLLRGSPGDSIVRAKMVMLDDLLIRLPTQTVLSVEAPAVSAFASALDLADKSTDDVCIVLALVAAQEAIRKESHRPEAKLSAMRGCAITFVVAGYNFDSLMQELAHELPLVDIANAGGANIDTSPALAVLEYLKSR
jgi:hypothetical protein